MQPKISVIIVVFNGADTLPQAIESVLGQTYNNVELIVVDGGSTDGTLDILRKYKANNFIWISEPDNGIYDAMNKGIKMAMGDWIYFLGADDTFRNKNLLKEIFNGEKKIDCDFLYGNVYSLALKKKYDGEFDEDKILFQNICHQSIFYKREIHEKIGFYNVRYKTFADWDFNIRCFYNPQIKRKYLDIIIANFAAGGLGTSEPDLDFLRNYLFSKNLWALNIKGTKKLYNIRFYDKWWRLIRSLKLKAGDDISNYAENEKLPLIISRMYSFQKHIPHKLLWTGIFSKTFMFLSYSYNIIPLMLFPIQIKPSHTSHKTPSR